MNIVVCLKQVPDTTAVKINPITGTLIREGVPSIINPEDKNALEAALTQKDKNGAKVTVVSMGPPQAKKALREALAMGADEAILISDRAFAGADTLATSEALAGVLRKLSYDIVFAGRQAIDGDTAQVGPELAEHLNIPQVTYVQGLKLDKDKLIVNRALEDGYELIEVKMPVLLTTIKEINKPRYMSAKKIFATMDDMIKVWDASDINVEKERLGLKGSPTKVKKSWVKEINKTGVLLNKPIDEMVEDTIRILKEKHLI